MKKNQKSIFEQIAKVTALDMTFEDLQIEQTPTNLQDPVRVADFATGVVGAFGANVAEIGQLRGLPKQTISVDRRLATHSLDSAMWQYMNGVVIEGGEIAVAGGLQTDLENSAPLLRDRHVYRRASGRRSDHRLHDRLCRGA